MSQSIERATISRRIQRGVSSVFLTVVLALGGLIQPGHTQSPTVSAGKSGAPMQRFVFLFRPGTTQLSEADQKQRSEEILVWAKRQNEEGRKLDPRALGKEKQWIAPTETEEEPGDVGSLSNLLFLEAHNFDQAVAIAKTHPGLRYGASVEVRAWTTPVAQKN